MKKLGLILLGVLALAVIIIFIAVEIIEITLGNIL